MPRSRAIKSDDSLVCFLRRLPDDMEDQAARDAISINPMNAPRIDGQAAVALASMAFMAPETGWLTAFTDRKWKNGCKLGVKFMEPTSSDLKNKILQYANLWSPHGNISFHLSNDGPIRLTLGQPGYWSNLGTDLLLVGGNQPTMCLGGFTMRTPDATFRQVVPHEFGHSAGFPHEHLRAEEIERMDRQAVLRLFRATQGWNDATIISNVLTPLDPRKIEGSASPDRKSIMAYRLPSSIFRDGVGIEGGSDLSPEDKLMAGRIYPLSQAPPGDQVILNVPRAGRYVWQPE